MPDGSIDVVRPEATNPLTLDIAVTGCGRFDLQGTCDPGGAVGPCCSGAPPLALSFAPVGSPDLVQFRWKFGDQTPDVTDRAPTHTYAYPGSYQVTLVGAGASVGAISPPRPLTVVVEPLAGGSPCDVDSQCGGGLTCWCAPGSDCPAAFVRGMCAAPCAPGCAAGSSCASVPFVPHAGGAAGRTSICLASCQTDAGQMGAACAPGSVCQTLPPGESSSDPWVNGCLPLGALQDVGGPCRDANDALADAACATGVCADLGALGICSSPCVDSERCPPDTVCALQKTGQSFCLPPCATDADCARDPLLACTAAASNDVDAGAGVTVCQPRRCTSDAVCGIAGRCGAQGICIR